MTKGLLTDGEESTASGRPLATEDLDGVVHEPLLEIMNLKLHAQVHPQVQRPWAGLESTTMILF